MVHPRATAAFAATLLLCAPLTARAGFRCSAKGGPVWREYRSKHFVVYTDVAPFKVQLLVRELERMHALELQALVGEQVEIPGRLRVLAFGDPSLFTELAGSRSIGALYGHSSMREPFIALPVVGLEAEPEMIAHELAHHLSRFMFPHQPAWFSEGLAQFVQTIADASAPLTPDTGSHIVRGSPAHGGNAGATPLHMVDALQLAPAVPVRELLDWDGHADSESGKYHLYSWLLYHWLWNARSKQFTAFQQRLSIGDEPAAALRAEVPELDPGKPASLAKVDAALEQYRRAGRYASYRVDAQFDGAFTAGPVLSPAEMHAWIFDASGHLAEEMLAGLDEAAGEDATHPVLIAVRKSGEDERLLALRKAAAARPGDWRVWLLLGASLSDAFRDEPEKQAAYRKAVSLNPDSEWAHIELAHQLVTHGRAKEALPFANRALDLDPADPDAIQALAEVAAETGKCKEALILQRRATSMLPAKAPAAEAFRKRLAEYDARCGTATPAAASVVPPTAR
jgi:Flp pilus assembly protein TadD